MHRDKERPMRLSNTADFVFKTATSSKIVKDAIKRYKYLILHSGTAEHHECSSLAVNINTVVIVVWNENEALNIDTNYDYELTISIETKDAMITANSSFGVMYVFMLSCIHSHL